MHALRHAGHVNMISEHPTQPVPLWPTARPLARASLQPATHCMRTCMCSWQCSRWQAFHRSAATTPAANCNCCYRPACWSPPCKSMIAACLPLSHSQQWQHAACMPLVTSGRPACAACALRWTPGQTPTPSTPLQYLEITQEASANNAQVGGSWPGPELCSRLCSFMIDLGGTDGGLLLVPDSARTRPLITDLGDTGCAGCSLSRNSLAPVPSVFHLQAQARSCCRPRLGLSSVRGSHAQHTALRSTFRR
jgi:hypothetical protein